MEQVPKPSDDHAAAAARVGKAFDAVGRMSGSFREADDKRFAEQMDRWLANGGAAKFAAALSRSASLGKRA